GRRTGPAGASGSRPTGWVRPSILRIPTPASSSTFTCREIVGFDTPKPSVASPIGTGPRASRSTIARRIGWASALNGSLAITLTIHADDFRRASAHTSDPRAGCGRFTLGACNCVNCCSKAPGTAPVILRTPCRPLPASLAGAGVPGPLLVSREGVYAWLPIRTDGRGLKAGSLHGG